MYHLLKVKERARGRDRGTERQGARESEVKKKRERWIERDRER